MNRYVLICTIVILITSCKNQPTYDYFGQTEPSNTSEVFAKGIISLDGRYEQNIAFSPDATECILVISEKHWNSFTMLKATYQKNSWSSFDTISFSKNVNATLEPFYTPDSKQVYFTSNAFPSTQKWDTDIWRVSREKNNWSSPVRLDSLINKEGKFSRQWFPSISEHGNLYYVIADTVQTDIYMASQKGDGFLEPIKLSNAINSNKMEWEPLIAPDESFLLFASRHRKDSYGGQDFYVSFKDSKNEWGEAIHLGKEINSEYMEQSPSFSPDGKYLFFGRLNTKTWKCDLHWINISFLDKYRK